MYCDRTIMPLLILQSEEGNINHQTKYYKIKFLKSCNLASLISIFFFVGASVMVMLIIVQWFQSMKRLL